MSRSTLPSREEINMLMCHKKGYGSRNLQPPLLVNLGCQHTKLRNLKNISVSLSMNDEVENIFSISGFAMMSPNQLGWWRLGFSPRLFSSSLILLFLFRIFIGVLKVRVSLCMFIVNWTIYINFMGLLISFRPCLALVWVPRKCHDDFSLSFKKKKIKVGKCWIFLIISFFFCFFRKFIWLFKKI